MGNTTTKTKLTPMLQDHPHIHGEYAIAFTHNQCEQGSPPHTWGILRAVLMALLFTRITPTYMGNTHLGHSNHLLRQGSPPHTWGILIRCFRITAGKRITPTYMGNTKIHRPSSPRLQDHPHIHGEYCAGAHGQAHPRGSPPHTWGIHPLIPFAFTVLRITPTYMGNT